jgi:hypothetical protein
MNMAVGLIALRREEKAVPLAFNFHLLLVHDMTISLSQRSGTSYLAVITTGGSKLWVWGMFEPGRFGVSPGAIL